MPRVLLFASLLLIAGSARAGSRPSRTFDFTYAGAITGLAPAQAARVWLPVPPGNDDQTVREIGRDLPRGAQPHTEPKSGNAMLYFEAAAGGDGAARFSVTYRVTRYEVSEQAAPPDESDTPYLAADQLVPIGGKPTQVLLAGKTLPADQMSEGRVLYDLVDDHLQYRKDKPGWGHGDAVWACDSGFGNCTDFHSLFISLARTQKIPAKFEIGFAIPKQAGSGEIAGYHCWAKFKPAGHGWVPVDISEANQDPSKREYDFGHLSVDRVKFSTGRDLTLVPPQAGPPLNFLIYPYVEVDGKPWPAERCTRQFRYQNVPDERSPAPATKPTALH